VRDEQWQRGASLSATSKRPARSLSPVYSGSEENKQFFAATPGGSIMLHVVNEKGMAVFEEGKEYYVDFTPAS